jgi:hypothetical protein
MTTAYRKLGHEDFRKRVARVDPRFHRLGHAAYARDTTVAKPFGSVLLGFGWIYFVSAISTNRAHIEESLRQGTLPQEYHVYIFAGLAVMLMASVVLLGMHLLRYFVKRGAKRSNSGGVLIGALGALVLYYTPDSVWQHGYGMLDSHSQGALMTASNAFNDSFPSLAKGSVAFVSSNGN